MNKYVLKNEDRIMRPVTMSDAEFIVRLRNQPHVKGRVHDSVIDVQSQKAWLEAYFKRENEYYWIIETLDHRPIGTESLYNYNSETNTIESGRWVLLANERINLIASTIQFFDFAFDVLGVDRIVFDIVATNKSVIRYQELCGAVPTHVIKESGIGGKAADVIWYEQKAVNWPVNRAKISHFCRNIDSFETYLIDDGIMRPLDVQK